MPPTKMLNYRNWRISQENKSFSNVLTGVDQSFYETVLKSGGWLGDNKIESLQQVKRGGTIKMIKKPDEHEFRKLVRDLKQRCEKERVFRKDKVAKIKQLIKNKQYNITGKQVVDKWFPDDSVF